MLAHARSCWGTESMSHSLEKRRKEEDRGSEKMTEGVSIKKRRNWWDKITREAATRRVEGEKRGGGQDKKSGPQKGKDLLRAVPDLLHPRHGEATGETQAINRVEETR